MGEALKYILGAIFGAGVAFIITKEVEGQRGYEEGLDQCKRRESKKR